MKYVIGIDGGGTKTHVLLADLDGNVLSSKLYGSTNPNAISKETLNETFRLISQDINEEVSNSLSDVSSVFAGMSGAGSEDTARSISEIISGYFLPETKIKVVPDMINALYSGTFGKQGIVQISGTGSITYGINRKNQHARVGGWGYLLGDEGSGYDVGKKGLSAVLQHVDGRGPKTALLDILFDHFQVATGRELIDKIYQSPSPRIEISQVSKLVFKAYEENDLVAMEILRSVATEISQCIMVLERKLFKEEEKVEVILCGGLFSNKEVLPTLLKDALIDYPKRLSFVLPEFPPVVGSVMGANIEIGNHITSSIVDNLRKFSN